MKAPGAPGRSAGASADPRAEQAATLVARVGGHVARELGLDLQEADDPTLARWLAASFLTGGRSADPGRRAYGRLESAGWLQGGLGKLAVADGVEIEGLLGEAGVSRPEGAAGVLCRIARTLSSHTGGSVTLLLEGAEDLEDAARRLSALAPGFGRSSVLRFLTPLRASLPVLAELPASPAAVAAAVDLGLVSEGCDEESLPGSLSGLTPEHAADAVDLEAALDRLGRASCLRGRVERCPLGAACARRHRSAG